MNLFSVSLCRTVHQPSALSQYRAELCELSRLAWRGLEESKILFLKEDVPHNVLGFAIRTGLLSQVRLTIFIHSVLVLQSFLRNEKLIVLVEGGTEVCLAYSVLCLFYHLFCVKTRNLEHFVLFGIQRVKLLYDGQIV